MAKKTKPIFLKIVGNFFHTLNIVIKSQATKIIPMNIHTAKKPVPEPTLNIITLYIKQITAKILYVKISNVFFKLKISLL